MPDHVWDVGCAHLVVVKRHVNCCRVNLIAMVSFAPCPNEHILHLRNVQDAPQTHLWCIFNITLYLSCTISYSFCYSLFLSYVQSIHTVVCRAAQETRGAWQTSVYFKGVKKILFSHICSSTLLEQKHTKFSVRIPSGWGTSNFIFELNLPSCSRDMCLQSSPYFLHIFLLLLLFATLFEITITHACFDGLPWNSKHY